MILVFILIMNQIALGHTRLSIIDTSSNGRQPMVSESKDSSLATMAKSITMSHLGQNLLN